MGEEIKKKRLLIATDSFLPRWDGVARVLKEIIPLLAKKYEITLLVPNFPGRTPILENVRMVRFPLMKMTIGDYTPPKPSLRRIKKEVKQSDIIWGQTIGPIGAVAMHYAKRHKKPLLAYIHSVEWELFSNSIKRFKRVVRTTIKFAVKRLYNQCDLLLVPSRSTAVLLEERGIKAKKEIVHLGVETERFRIPSSREKAKEMIGLNPEETVVGYLGRFGREKNLETLYKAFRSARIEHPELRLLLVGGEREVLEEYIDSFENVTVIGSTDTPETYYAAMDIYALPSLTETTSLTTLEAMSSGLPVICTTVGHIPDYIEHKVNGFLFPPKTVERMAILIKMLAKDKKLREQIGKAARKTVLKEYSWKKTAEKLSEAIGRYG